MDNFSNILSASFVSERESMRRIEFVKVLGWACYVDPVSFLSSFRVFDELPNYEDLSQILLSKGAKMQSRWEVRRMTDFLKEELLSSRASISLIKFSIIFALVSLTISIYSYFSLTVSINSDNSWLKARTFSSHSICYFISYFSLSLSWIFS